MMMQDFALVEDFTALENVMIPLNFSKKKIPNKKEKALAALRSVGIEELAKKPCNKLSGGQKQRVAIARAIVDEPSMILADEPTGVLDSKTSAEIMELFKSLNERGGRWSSSRTIRRWQSSADGSLRYQMGRYYRNNSHLLLIFS